MPILVACLFIVVVVLIFIRCFIACSPICARHCPVCNSMFSHPTSFMSCPSLFPICLACSPISRWSQRCSYGIEWWFLGADYALVLVSVDVWYIKEEEGEAYICLAALDGRSCTVSGVCMFPALTGPHWVVIPRGVKIFPTVCTWAWLS